MWYRADGAGAGLTAGDDTVVGGPKTPQQIAAQKRLQQTQAQVDEVCNAKMLKEYLLLDFFFTMYSLGGRYHENERDEGTGQGSKTVRTG